MPARDEGACSAASETGSPGLDAIGTGNAPGSVRLVGDDGSLATGASGAKGLGPCGSAPNAEMAATVATAATGATSEPFELTGAV